MTLTGRPAVAQYYGVRVNALALATGTLNAALEAAVSDRVTLDLPLLWNPIKTDRLLLRITALQPGARYWFYEAFVGHFIGGHAAFARYEIGNDRWHYKGWMAGMGISYGYSWLLHKRWNLTLEAGAGIYYTRDQRREHYVPDDRDAYIWHFKRFMLLPSRCEISFTYLF